jgi:hypothetical protein
MIGPEEKAGTTKDRIVVGIAAQNRSEKTQKQEINHVELL